MNYIVMKKDFIIYSIIRRHCRYQRCNLYKNADVKTIFASNPEAMTQIESGDSYTGCVVGGGSEAPEYVVVLWNL